MISPQEFFAGHYQEALRRFFGQQEHGSAEFGGGNIQASSVSESDRYGQAAGRGTADATFGNISKAIGFGMGLGPASPFGMALGSGLGALTGIEGMGVPSYTGFSGLTGPRPRSLGDLQRQQAEARSRERARSVMENTRGASPSSRMGRGGGGGRMGGGGIGSGNATGGPGYGTAR